jgi:NHS family nucleoside permease-like MFS transporter
MFLMMTNGFGCILGGMVSGKVVEHFTVEGSLTGRACG